MHDNGTFNYKRMILACKMLIIRRKFVLFAIRIFNLFLSSLTLMNYYIQPILRVLCALNGCDSLILRLD